MKLVVIGGNPAGLSAASAVRRARSDWDVVVYEKGPYISYGSCGLPYYIEGVVKNKDNLITITRERFLQERNIPINIFHEVKSVNFDAKTVTIVNLENNDEFIEKYDYLMIATGGKPKIPPELKIEHERIFFLHTIEDADRIKEFLIKTQVESGILIGTGYINLETVEAYKALGIDDLTVIGPRLIFRTKSQEYIRKELEKHGIKMIIGEYVKNIEPISDDRLKVLMQNGIELEADFIQVGVGVVPNTSMFKGTGLKMMDNGAIIVDKYMRTNIENVFAGGDCACVYHRILKKNTYIPLAPAANKQGRIAGNVIAGKKVDPFPGVVGTSAWKVFDLYCAKTGITENEARELGYEPATILIEANEIAHYYPNRDNLFQLKMSVLYVFDTISHKLLGAEITAPSPLGAKKIDVLATALAAEMKIDDIQKLDLSYAPPFAPVWDPILVAANVARRKCK
ncbi:MAG: FAD-dependent oxidoreductase [Promethearchaeota archaeon]